MITLYHPTIVIPPSPTTPVEAARWQATGLRRRMLYGAWLPDLQNRIVSRVGPARADAWGQPDMSANPFRALCGQVSVLYDEPPILSHPDDPGGTAAAMLTTALEESGVWSLMARVQRDAVGLREMLLRVDIDEESGALAIRPVYPDFVCAKPKPQQPDQIASIREARLRETKVGEEVWAYDVIDPKTRTYRVETPLGEDISTAELGAASSGEAYPYIYADGTPYLPYALYHAAKTGMLWDPYEAVELVDGTLNVGLLWTFWNHCVQDASWPQRYAAGWEAIGGRTEGDPDAPRTTVEVDPAILLQLRRALNDEGGGQGLIGQFQPGADPQKLAEAVSSYERRLAAYAGLSPSDFARVSGDPRSGYALSISRDGQREAARRLEPQFRRGDVQLLSICAAQLNRWSERQRSPLNLPEKGWRVRYQALPPSPAEIEAKRKDVIERFNAGLMSELEAYMELHPGVTEQEARQMLAEIAEEKAERAKRSALLPSASANDAQNSESEDNGAEDDDMSDTEEETPAQGGRNG